MTSHSNPSKQAGKAQTRNRVSERTLAATLKAMRDAGMSVDRVCITGGKVEIHTAPIAGETTVPDDEGLEKW
ncbi:hypothetical protein [Rhizobium sp. Leaf386]|uniref:hypothetical protein n=1 Tax=Rhizobium sp. Leaf386 TaxID=1736359 RepID=UPI000712EB3B|nr:hypothetical protein [Rhizobium sp. Leaf386]KQS95335.1 hypothetical protein ASG50_25245 [Rhizobium sp. Leaf386]